MDHNRANSRMYTKYRDGYKRGGLSKRRPSSFSTTDQVIIASISNLKSVKFAGLETKDRMLAGLGKNMSNEDLVSSKVCIQFELISNFMNFSNENID
jgi:hypothetical protein